jgi:hypothetical protein
MLCQCCVCTVVSLSCIDDISEEQSSGACSGVINALRREIYLITCKFHIPPDSALVIHYKDSQLLLFREIIALFCGNIVEP